MSNKTLKNKERYLNEIYTDSYTEDQAVETLIYLTNKRRGLRTTEAHLRKCYRCRKLGTLLRRLDPTAFYTD